MSPSAAPYFSKVFASGDLGVGLVIEQGETMRRTDSSSFLRNDDLTFTAWFAPIEGELMIGSKIKGPAPVSDTQSGESLSHQDNHVPDTDQ